MIFMSSTECQPVCVSYSFLKSTKLANKRLLVCVFMCGGVHKNKLAHWPPQCDKKKKV